jgi:DNA-binding transcriptional ArsR family regulator
VGRQLTDRVLLGDTLDFEAAAAPLFAISHALRWEISRLAAVDERDASSLAYELNVTEPIISKHLVVLRRERLLESRSEGRRVFYTTPAITQRLLHVLAELQSSISRR